MFKWVSYFSTHLYTELRLWVFLKTQFTPNPSPFPSSSLTPWTYLQYNSKKENTCNALSSKLYCFMQWYRQTINNLHDILQYRFVAHKQCYIQSFHWAREKKSNVFVKYLFKINEYIYIYNRSMVPFSIWLLYHVTVYIYIQCNLHLCYSYMDDIEHRNKCVFS